MSDILLDSNDTGTKNWLVMMMVMMMVVTMAIALH